MQALGSGRDGALEALVLSDQVRVGQNVDDLAIDAQPGGAARVLHGGCLPAALESSRVVLVVKAGRGYRRSDRVVALASRVVEEAALVE